jgi:hypothetical protein
MLPLDRYGKSIYSTELDLSELQNSIVLEQLQTLCLRQAPLTQIYYICDTQRATPLLKTNEWAQAYQFWIEQIRKIQFSGNSTLLETFSVLELHCLIDQSRENPEFGQLLYSCDRKFPGILQYSVQLSVDHAIRWAPITNHPIGQGEFIIEKVGRRRHRPAKWVEQQPTNVMTDILLRSIEAFHQCWDYNLYQFNSEHWARLIVTGDCCTLQTEEIYRHWKNTQTFSDPSILETEPIILEINSEVSTLLHLAIAP